MKIVEARREPYIFTKEELVKLHSKFNKLKIMLVDSYGYYFITGSRETVDGLSYSTQLSKLLLALDKEYNLYCDTVTHDEIMYFVFEKA
jgi:hypothetical protein